MPIRNGKAVDWKLKLPSFGNIVSDEEMSVKDKMLKLADLLSTDINKSIFSREGEDFPKQLRGFVDEFGDREDVLEMLGNKVIDEIYDYADYHLIWLGK